MAEEHGEYKFNREQRRRLDNRRAGAHEHNRMGRGYSLPDWQPYNHNQNHENGKGDLERPSSISEEEKDLRWSLAFGKITEEEFAERMEKLNG